ncbi:hypothetical protein L1987_60116 [Smallanthus sonchifolius]|uniref:Uncharacterized protein n=1 Tax=Smallanthus sonchifolius TaxID=185202 RepID=A0ACB9D748_9ASTR|nr:hypothetical protein L1987_60116 [Smallanthus sonchifolius]
MNSLVDEVTRLRHQGEGNQEQLKRLLAKNEMLFKVNETILAHDKLADQGKRVKDKQKSTRDEAFHPFDLTKDDDKDKDPEVDPSGSEHQALAIVPLTTVPTAQGESAQPGDASGSCGGSEHGKSAAEVLEVLSNEVILLLEPDYSKAEQINALNNLEEGQIESDNEWDMNDEDVVVEFPKGDGEGTYDLEDGEIFEAPDFEAAIVDSVEADNVAEASGAATSTETSPVDPQNADATDA